MAAIIECKQFDFPAVSLYRPHDPAGLWIIQVKETAKNETRSFSNNGIGNVAMTVEKLRLLRDALNRELADVPPPLPQFVEVGAFENDDLEVAAGRLQVDHDCPSSPC